MRSIFPLVISCIDLMFNGFFSKLVSDGHLYSTLFIQSQLFYYLSFSVKHEVDSILSSVLCLPDSV